MNEPFIHITLGGFTIMEKNINMKWTVKGKYVLITGATSGIGLAAAKELASRGANLGIIARNQSKACYRHITRRTSGRLAFADPTNFPAPEKWLKQSENR